MEAFILAAGEGVRLRPLTETRPKPLMPILGETLICRTLRIVSRHASSVGVVVSPGSKRLVEEALEGCRTGARVRLLVQGRALGTGDAVRIALSEAGRGDVLIVYGDLYLGEETIEPIARARPPAILSVWADDASQYGLVRERGGMLVGIAEKSGGSGYVFAGVMKLSRDHLEYFESLKPSPRGELEATDGLASIASREDVEVVKLEGGARWRDVGRPWDLLIANRMELETIRAPRIEGEVSGTAVVRGPVIVEEGAVIGDFSVVEGPAYIGRGAVVGPNSHVRKYSVLLEGARVGFASEVKASILMEGSRAPHMNYVGDSIIGERVNLGAGSVTANLRFDRGSVKMCIKGSRVDTGLRKLGAVIGGEAQIGINVSILPGIKIGSKAWVGPGCIVDRDVASGEKVICRNML